MHRRIKFCSVVVVIIELHQSFLLTFYGAVQIIYNEASQTKQLNMPTPQFYP